MKNSPSIFIDTALLALFLIGVQYSDLDERPTEATASESPSETMVRSTVRRQAQDKGLVHMYARV